MRKLILLTAATLLAAGSTAAQAQNPGKGEGANAPSANPSGGAAGPRGGPDNAPSARENAPGQMKGDKESAKDLAPGQTKDAKDSARDDAPGQKKRDTSDDKGDADKSPKPRTEKSGSGGSDSAAGADKGQDKSLAQIPAEKKSQVRSAFGKHRVEPVRDLKISINVGVAVPRNVRLYAVPEDIVVIYPAYRRYRYFLIDDQICIVDPVTFEIVEIIVIA